MDVCVANRPRVSSFELAKLACGDPDFSLTGPYAASKGAVRGEYALRPFYPPSLGS